MIKNKSICFILVILSLFISLNLWGYGDGQIHIEKQRQVLGLYEYATPGTRLRVDEVLVFIQIKIDMGGHFPKYYDDFRKKMLPFVFTSLDYGHRLFTHCGFNTYIKESLAIEDCFKSMRYSTNANDGGHPHPTDLRERLIFDIKLKSLKDERIDIGYKFLQEKKNEANREILEEIETQLGAFGDISTAIATLIYDTHLIGDYASEKEGNALSGAATETLLPFDLLNYKDVKYKGWLSACEKYNQNSDFIYGIYYKKDNFKQLDYEIKRVESKDNSYIVKHSLEHFDCIDGRGRKSKIIQETIKELNKAAKNGKTTKERAANVEAVLIKYIPRCIQNTRVLKRCLHGVPRVQGTHK